MLSAAVINGTITLTDISANSSSTFNFSTQAVEAGGHFYFNGTSDSLSPANGATILFLGDVQDEATFNSSLNKVPNSSFTNVLGDGYSQSSQAVFANDVLAFFTSSTYGVVYVRNVQSGTSAELVYKYNNISGNTSFGDPIGCFAHTAFNACANDVANDCHWQEALCAPFDGFFDLPPAECDMMPKAGCDGIDNNICLWNSSASTHGLCIEGPSFDATTGFNCTNIVNETFCNNQPFTEKTGLCSWNGSACLINNTKTFEDIQEPPVFSCESPQSLNNQTFCEDLASIYYMPCGWNNATSKCSDMFFNHDKFDNFEEIGSENTCMSMGGAWKSETTFDPLNSKVTTESWCEFGVSVKTFEQVGSGGGFTSVSGQLNDCSVDCFACEFNQTGGQWPTSSAAQNACENSAAGCTFRQDSNAFNSFGWCDPVAAGFSCESFCGDCNLQPSPQSACVNSPANCKWDNHTQECLGAGQKTCAQECMQCFDSSSCSSSGASGGCFWDSESSICVPQGGSYEVCYDGQDNDNNGKTDCADSKCSSDPFCGGDLFDTNNCFQYESNQSACNGASGCAWISDDFGFSFCAPESEQCFMNQTLEENASLCNSFGGGDVCNFFSDSRCDINTTMEESCFGLNSTACDSNTACQWLPEEGFCEFAPFAICENQTLQGNQTLCENSGCVWLGENGFGLNCEVPCFDPSIENATACGAAGTGNFSGVCEWATGFCEPANFIGGCPEFDGNRTACEGNTNCVWFNQTGEELCEDKMQNTFFQGMDEAEPTPIAADGPDAGVPGYLDVVGLGVKKSPEAYMYGMPLVGVAPAALCNGLLIQGQTTGTGQNSSKHYLYLDTDGTSTGGCAADDNPNIQGFEYLFAYEVDFSNGKAVETRLSKKCVSGSWSPSNIPFKSNRPKGCDFVGGPIIAIDKDIFTAKSNVDTSTSWRAYATTANGTGNSSVIKDSVGPGTADLKGIDAEVIDCLGTKNRDNSQCTKFKQFGFFPGEFGPACVDTIDNDGDGSADCSDLDCIYDPFFCSGDFSSLADDASSPTFVWSKVNAKVPTSLKFIADTNEPSNLTVNFYYNDSKCSVLNDTILDEGLLDGDSLTNFRPHHVASKAGLTAGTTYHYKLKACDPSGTCAVSKCSNATTSSTHSNVTFKLEVPSACTIDIPSLGLSAYDGQFALKASTEYLDNINLSVNCTGGHSITFVGISIFEKQTLNISGFITGSGLLGIDSNQYQSFKQKAGLRETVIRINATGDKVEHCDDSGDNCKDVTSQLSCDFDNAPPIVCIIPDALGLGFSSYKTSSTPSSSPSGNSGGGGGGGGGGAVYTTGKMSFASLPGNVKRGMVINKKGVYLTDISFTPKETLLQRELDVREALSHPGFPGRVVNAFEITTNIGSFEVDGITFTVALTEDQLGPEDPESLSIYRYNEETLQWDELPTSHKKVLKHVFTATTPGFSYFALGERTEQESSQPVVEENATSEEEAYVAPQPEPEPVQAAPEEKEVEEAEEKGFLGWALAILAVMVIFLIFYVRSRRI